MKRFVLLAGLVALLPVHGSAGAQENFVFKGKPPELGDYGYLVRGAAWRFEPGEKRIIFVCWENPTPANEEARGWVRDQISKTWQRHTALEFRGWRQCAERNAGIRIESRTTQTAITFPDPRSTWPAFVTPWRQSTPP